MHENSEKRKLQIERTKNRVGDIRYHASFFDKLEFDQFVFRTARGEWGYLVQKVQGLTWVKRSKAHHDWGWATSIPDYMRRKFLLARPIPYHASKRGALVELIADLRRQITKYGPDYCEDYDGEEEPEPALGIKLSRALAAQKRLRKDETL